MDRRTKYTHITARTNSFLKTLSSYTLEETCNDTLSWAYRRLSEGKGLITIYDQETFELLTKVINKVRRITSPVKLSKENYSSLAAARNALLENLEDYRSYIENGSQPEYIYDILSVTEVNTYILNVACGESISAARNELCGDINSLKRQLKLFKENTQGEDWFITYDTVYQIRVGYDDKQSNSIYIRDLLDGILNIQCNTDMSMRKVLEDDLQIIRDFLAWREAIKELREKKKMLFKEDEILQHLLDTLTAIQIPEYRSQDEE